MDNRTRMTGSTGSAGYRLEKTIVERVVSDPTIYRVITRGVAKSVCHRDRRSLPNRQLRRLCRTDFGSPTTKQTKLHTVSSRASLLDPGSSLLERSWKGGK